MKKLSQPTVMRSTCNKSSNYLYELAFDTVSEAQRISDEIHKVIGLSMPPKIHFSRRQTSRLLGTCWPDGKIVLRPPKGQQVGTLLHELAHLHKLAVYQRRESISRGWRKVSHGSGFKAGLAEIKRVWESIKHKYVHEYKPVVPSVQSVKVETSTYVPVKSKRELSPLELAIIRKRRPNFDGTFHTVRIV